MNKFSILTTLSAVVLATALPGLGWSADCTVTLGTDTGSAGELRDCIDNVATTDGDVVTINPNLTVNLTAGEISIPNSITIQGAGDGTSIVDGSGNGGARTFHINPTNADKGVLINGVTLQGANATVSGGAIYIEYEGALILEDSTINDNDSTTDGGGIYNDGSLIVDHCSFSLNDSDGSGGAIYSPGNLQVLNGSVFDQNTADSAGGIYQNGAAEIRDVVMTGNQATNNAGGALYSTTTFSLSNCQISGNTASSDGGGIYGDELVLIENCKFDGNTATNGSGGGIYNSEVLTLINSEVGPDNKSQSEGGGIYHNYGFISGSYIHDNESIASDGGGIYNNDYLALDWSRVEGNIAGGDGGGLDNGCCEMIVSNSSVTGNNADGSAGGILNSNDHMVIFNTTVSMNTADTDGGGIFNTGNLEINNSTIADNDATTGLGGGIYNDDQATLINTILANNTAGTSDPDCYNINTTLLASGGNNLIETVSANCALSGDTDSDIPPGTDPELGALADNGGPLIGTSDNQVRTLTMALASTSPAIDSGNNDTCEDTDQRGVDRPQGPDCDIGAVEEGPTADLSTTTVTFPETILGDTSDPIVVTLTNNGSIALEINSITVTGMDAGDFAQTNDCGSSLAVGASCNISITFTPIVVGVRQASITVDTAANIQLITLLGSGITGDGGCSCRLDAPMNSKSYVPIGMLAAFALAGLLLFRRRLN